MALPLVVTPAILAEKLATIQADGGTPRQSYLCLVDLRSEELYAAGHIAGAVRGDASLLNRSEKPVGGLMPEPAAVNQFLQSIGANLGDHIVAYDNGRETAAARLMWVLDAYGYEAGSWLDGGYTAWSAASLPIDTTNSKPQAGNLSLSLIGDNVISAEGLIAALDSPNIRILDVRSAAEFSGKDVRSRFGGHVPGASHLEWTSQLDERGSLLAEEALKAQLAERQIEPEHTVVVYCQTHQRSAVTYVALKNLGYEDVRALDGAWSNWGNREDTPKA